MHGYSYIDTWVARVPVHQKPLLLPQYLFLSLLPFSNRIYFLSVNRFLVEYKLLDWREYIPKFPLQKRTYHITNSQENKWKKKKNLASFWYLKEIHCLVLTFPLGYLSGKKTQTDTLGTWKSLIRRSKFFHKMTSWRREHLFNPDFYARE